MELQPLLKYRADKPVKKCSNIFLYSQKQRKISLDGKGEGKKVTCSPRLVEEKDSSTHSWDGGAVVQEEEDTRKCDEDGVEGDGVDVGEVLSESEAVGGGGVGKVRPGGRQSLFKPPTHEELQTLKEAQNLYQSNLMKLQVSHTHYMYHSWPCPLPFSTVCTVICLCGVFG